MNIAILKFGGTSVSTFEKRKACIAHIQKALDSGYHVVVVVSAMGRKGDPYATDSLLSLAQNLSLREKDLLLSLGELISCSVFSSELNDANISNTVLSGGQAGILTNEQYGNATIQLIHPHRVQSELSHHKVVIVAGFQGETLSGDITTLGRGGSDTTATAIADVLHADYVDIFTDVQGIMTADPHVIQDAQVVREMSYLEAMNLSQQGAKVLHPLAVSYAEKQKIPLRVRSTFSAHPGTLVTNSPSLPVPPIVSITHTSHLTQFHVKSGATESHVFSLLQSKGISIDFINANNDSIIFTVSDDLSNPVSDILLSCSLNFSRIFQCTKISLIGAGMKGIPGVMSTIAETLMEHHIPILQTADSHMTIWILINSENFQEAIKSLHYVFKLGYKK